MKRMFCLALVVLLLFSGCSGKKVKTPLTEDAINAIPVADASMTEEQLRQICLDFFRLQLSFQWTPKNSFHYTITTYQEQRSFQADTVYAGLPYQGSSRSGNIYLAMEYYDPATGILDNSGIDDQEFSHILGNHCTSSPYWAWMRVVNSVSRYTNTCMTQHYGFLPVGDYTYSTMQWSESVRTKSVCEENGEQTMFESYAQAKPADCIYMFYSLGGNSHCRMVSAEPVVVRDRDGRINGDESYLLYMDQGSSLKDYTARDGSVVKLQGKLDEKTTFRELFDKGYLPMTFAEFVGNAPVEPAQVTLNLPESAAYKDLVNGMITANYPISYIEVTLSDRNGQETYRRVTAADNMNVLEMALGKSVDISEVKALSQEAEQTVTVRVRVSTGQLLTAYCGQLSGQ